MGSKWYGWCGKVLYVDLDRQQVQARELSRELADKSIMSLSPSVSVPFCISFSSIMLRSCIMQTELVTAYSIV